MSSAIRFIDRQKKNVRPKWKVKLLCGALPLLVTSYAYRQVRKNDQHA